MKYYLENYETVLDKFNSNAEGISEDEAKKRLEEYGENKLKNMLIRKK